MKKLTPVMVVDAIEPCLPFWDRLGFQRTAEVPHGEALGFVMLQGGAVELMYQTVASVAADVPDMVRELKPGHTPLFIEVDDLKAVQAKLSGAELLVPERKTFYGATETVVRGPAGQVVTFAEFAKAGSNGEAKEAIHV